jgi:hypothetical protein
MPQTAGEAVLKVGGEELSPRTPGESCGKVTGKITPEPHSKTERHSEAEHGYNVTGSMNGAARSEDQITYATAQGA